MNERDWYEKAEEFLRLSWPHQWAPILAQARDVYRTHVKGQRPALEVEEILRGLAHRIEWEGRQPPYLVVAAPEMADLTPDDLVMEPAWNTIEVEALFDLHDGRNDGSMVVGVYRRDPELGTYSRDVSFGMLGDVNRKRAADSNEESDRL